MKTELSIDELVAAGKRFQDRASLREAQRSKKVASTEITERLETRLSLRGYSKVESEALVTLSKTGGQQAAATLERIINENDLTLRNPPATIPPLP